MATPEQLREIHRIACTYGGTFEDMASKALVTGDLEIRSKTTHRTMLEIAVADNSISAVKALLDAGANPNHHGEKNEHPLMVTLKELVAAQNNPQRSRQVTLLEGILTELLTHGADPEAITQPDAHPLNMAIDMENHNVVRLLLEHKANPNRYRPGEEHPPLHRAISNRDEASALALLQFGANPENKNRFGRAALESATRAGMDKVAKQIRNILARKAMKQPDMEL